MRLEGRKVLPDEIQFAAIEGNEVLGRMSVETTEGGWYITDIYVEPAHRRQGIGTFMVQYIVNTFDENGVFMPIEAAYGSDDANAGLHGFFKGQGNFVVGKSDTLVTVSPGQRAESPAYQKLCKCKKKKALLYSELEDRTKRNFRNHLFKTGEIVFLNDVDEGDYDWELCFATVKNNAVTTAAFVKEHGERQFELSYLYVRDRDAAGLKELLAAVISAFEEKHADAEIYFTIINENVEKLVEGLFGDHVTSTRGLVARWNGLPVV